MIHVKDKAATARRQKMVAFKLKNPASKTADKKQVEAREDEAKRLHEMKEAKKSRRRALESLSNDYAAKRQRKK